MCHFIALIAPCDDETAVRLVMERHDRTTAPIDNPSIGKALCDGERQYLTTVDHCDCGTALAPAHDTPEAFEEKLRKESARLKRRGWSEAKIARAMEDRRKADARPKGGGSDSLELWDAILRDLGNDLRLPHAGLLVRFYSGARAAEVFEASRREVDSDTPRLKALALLQLDEVTIFPLD